MKETEPKTWAHMYRHLILEKQTNKQTTKKNPKKQQQQKHPKQSRQKIVSSTYGYEGQPVWPHVEQS